MNQQSDEPRPDQHGDDMELNKALSQIEEIHGHIAKTQVYRGFRSVPIALTGATALIAGFAYPHLTTNMTPINFVAFWVGLAAVSVLIIGSEILYNYFERATVTARRTTRRVVGQFMPSIAAGIVVTIGVMAFDDTHTKLLPGIWAALFSLGIFSARPYLPRSIGWIALFYLIAGGILLLLRSSGLSALSLAMGVTFGVGQLFSAVVLYWNLERSENAQEHKTH